LVSDCRLSVRLAGCLALAWEYLRRHPDYRLDWLRRRRRPDTAHRWGLRLLEDPALDARDAHPAWLPGHAAVVQLYPDADPPQDADLRVLAHPRPQATDPRRQGLALIARSPGHCLRFALAPGLEDGMAVAYAPAAPRAAAPMHARSLAAPGCRPGGGPPRPTPAALLELHTLQALDATLAGASLREVAEGCSAPMPQPIGTATAACAPRCAAWCIVAMR
jgi:hypothetical protein